MKGNRQLVVPTRDGAGKRRPRQRLLLRLRFSRYLRQMAAAGSGLALLSVMVVSPVVAAPASAVGTAWYAYAGGRRHRDAVGVPPDNHPFAAVHPGRSVGGGRRRRHCLPGHPGRERDGRG